MKAKGKREGTSLSNVLSSAALRDYTQRGRITGMFGVFLPPKKVQVVSRHLTIRFVITGTIPSKKNQARAASNIRFINKIARKSKTASEAVGIIDDRLRLFIRNSPVHEQWKKDITPKMTEQAAHWAKKYQRFNLIYPIGNVSMKIYHYWSDNKRRDLSGKLETIQDMFVDAGILLEDTWQSLGQVSSKAECYGGQITESITTVDITIKVPNGGLK